MNKEYVYKWYTGGVYNGVLQNVLSEFSLSQQINSAGTSLEIELGIALKDANPTLETVDLVDEDGNNITDETSENIALSKTYSVSGIPSLNDRIEVWEFSEDNPSGVKMFNGLVSKWSASYLDTTTKITVLSYGVQLDNYLVQILPEDILTNNSVLNYDSSQVIHFTHPDVPTSLVTAVAQTFQISIDAEVINIKVYCGDLSTTFTTGVTLTVKEGTPLAPGSTLGSVSRVIDVSSLEMIQFSLSTAISLSQSTTYHIVLEAFNTGPLLESAVPYVGIQSTGSYANGNFYTYTIDTGWSTALSSDMIFEVTTSTGAIGNQFNSYDPSTILTELIDNFNALGGVVTYSDSSVDLTSSLVSYTFKFNTYLDAIKKVVELAPSNWWWWVDPANDLIYFSSRPTTPDHTFIIGNHLAELNLSYSLEEMKNKVYFSGGDTGSGDNLLTFNSNESSVTQYGSWLDLPSDNRVILEDTANVISNSILGEFSRPKFAGKVEIPSTTYDITTIRPGHVVSFLNGGTLIDSLTLQVYATIYKPDSIELTLAVLPPTQSKRIEDIRRNLRKQETENNPNT